MKLEEGRSEDKLSLSFSIYVCPCTYVYTCTLHICVYVQHTTIKLPNKDPDAQSTSLARPRLQLVDLSIRDLNQAFLDPGIICYLMYQISHTYKTP